LYHALDRVDEEHFERGLDRMVSDLRHLVRRGKNLLVLDGTGGGHPNGSEKNLSEHLRLIYSGSTMKADDWIERWHLRTALSKWELVSRDRRLFERIRRKGVGLVDPEHWYAALKRSERRSQGQVSKREQFQQGGKKPFGAVDEWLDYFGET
jgi:hypothetical protein